MTTYSPTEQGWSATGRDRTPLTIKGGPGQTANLFEIRDTNDVLVAAISAAGLISGAGGGSDTLRGIYGAVGDGVHDDTAAFQAAVSAAIAAKERLLVPAGTYKLSSTILLSNVSGFRLTGASANGYATTQQGTNFTWAGNTTDPMFKLSDASHCYFEHFAVKTSAANPLYAGFVCENGTGGSITPLENTWVHVVMDGGTNGIEKGWQYVGPVDANNDYGIWIDCSVSNFKTIGWAFDNSQCYANLLIGCHFRGNQSGRVGVGTNYDYDYVGLATKAVPGGNATGGSFRWIGGGGGGTLESDFWVGYGQGDAIEISNAVFESSARLLKAPGPSGAPMPVTVRSCRWAHATRLIADGYFIDYGLGGPLVLVGNTFQDSGSGNAMRVRVGPGGAIRAQLVMYGNYIETTSADPVALGGTGLVDQTRLGNNMYNRATTTYANVPNWLPGVALGNAGTAQVKQVAGTISIDPGSIAATSRGAITWTLTGAAVSDRIIMEPPAALDDDLLFVGARVTATNTVTLYLYNPTGGAIDDAAQTWNYTWIDLT